MKTLMKKVGGCKKARFWNMAQFQTRRWHREQAAAAATANQPPSATASAPAVQDPPPPESFHPPLIQQSTNPSIRLPAHPLILPSTPEPSGVPPLIQSSNNPPILSSAHPPILPSLPRPARTGKIARLPEEVRVEVNHLLRHGVKYAEICDHLAKIGYPGVSVNNIYNWKHGGFVDWYRDMQAREAALTPLKALERCSRSMDIDRWQQNAILMAAEKFGYIMAGLNHAQMIEALHEKPELFPKFVAAMASLSRCSADLAKAFDLTRGHEATLRHDLDLKNNPPTLEPEDEEVESSTSPSSSPLQQPDSIRATNPVLPLQPNDPLSKVACTASSPIQVNPAKSRQIQVPDPVQPPSTGGDNLKMNTLPGDPVAASSLASTVNKPGLNVNNLSITNTAKKDSQT